MVLPLKKKNLFSSTFTWYYSETSTKQTPQKMDTLC